MHAKFLRAFSNKAVGLEMSKNSTDCGVKGVKGVNLNR